VRTLVKLNHEVGRLEAERDGVLWDDPVQVQRSNMHGIRKLQDENQADNLAALSDVLLELAERRDEERDRIEIAEGISRRTGRPFHPGSLYRDPYRSRWRDVDPDTIVGRHLADGAAGASAIARWGKRLIIHHILRQRKVRAGLIEVRRAALLQQSVDEDWQPITDADVRPRRPGQAAAPAPAANDELSATAA
jgi:hypothetical protein